jgi:ADP-ribosylglycohydrolase
MDLRARIRGCLLGGAVGDALGAPIEFHDLAAIVRAHGPGGLREFVPAYGRTGAITDDTQMTLFTVEGLIRAHVRRVERGICHPPGVVHHAYFRWFATQRVKTVVHDVEAFLETPGPDGWLVGHRALWSRRAPGNTCLSALSVTPQQYGRPAANDSKGAGGIMRIAPVGLVYPVGDAFEAGGGIAALTHGHPTGILASACFAELIAQIVAGRSLHEAIEAARAPLGSAAEAGEVTTAIDRALSLAARAPVPSIGVVEELGGGWIAEEALAIALYCALVSKDFEDAIVLAVNHGGDSDTTGTLVGHLLGALFGDSVIPARWLEPLELRDVIEELAEDLSAVADETFDAEAATAKYPGW